MNHILSRKDYAKGGSLSVFAAELIYQFIPAIEFAQTSYNSIEQGHDKWGSGRGGELFKTEPRSNVESFKKVGRCKWTAIIHRHQHFK